MIDVERTRRMNEGFMQDEEPTRIIATSDGAYIWSILPDKETNEYYAFFARLNKKKNTLVLDHSSIKVFYTPIAAELHAKQLLYERAK